jgi:hypothetical protein
MNTSQPNHASLVFFVTAWMDKYDGTDTKADNGGDFVADHGTEIGEALNFKKQNGFYYGYAPLYHKEKPSKLALEKLGALKNDVEANDVTVVFVAAPPKKWKCRGRKIVGWYRNATVFRELQGSNNAKGSPFGYRAKAGDAVWLPPDKRDFEIPYIQKKGDFGLGKQATIQYASENNALTNSVLNYIDSSQKQSSHQNILNTVLLLITFLFIGLITPIEAQTLVGELSTIGKSDCQISQANPDKLSEIGDFVSCSDTTNKTMQVYSFPELEFVREISMPKNPQKPMSVPSKIITQKWVNSTDDFEVMEIRFDTLTTSGKRASYYSTVFYNESGNILLTMNGYCTFGVKNDIAYMYSLPSISSGTNYDIQVYKIRDIQTAMNLPEEDSSSTPNQIPNYFSSDILVSMLGSSLRITTPKSKENLRFVLLGVDGKKIAYSSQNKTGEHILSLGKLNGVGTVAAIDNEGIIQARMVIAK